MNSISVDVPARRQRRWHEAHDRLFDAACELFLEAGYARTSMEEIADRANVVRKTAFNHFPRKRDFISEWGLRRRQRVHEAMPSELMAEPRFDVLLHHYFTELASSSIEERALTINMTRGWREQGGPFDNDPHQLVGLFRSFIEDAARRGEISTSVNADHVGTLLYSTYFGILYDWCEGSIKEPPFNLKESYAHLLEIICAGLRAM